MRFIPQLPWLHSESHAKSVVPLIQGPGDMLSGLFRAAHVLQVGSYWLQLIESTREVLSQSLSNCLKRFSAPVAFRIDGGAVRFWQLMLLTACLGFRSMCSSLWEPFH